MPRRLGQHFLTDPTILDRIVYAINPHPHDVVVEIGAGQGSLTRRLAPHVGHVVAVEKDRTLVDQWPAAPAPMPPNVTLIQGDALDLDWPSLVGEHASRLASSFKVAGNIPYAITTPLIEKALRPPSPAVIVFLVQREVADRLAANPGTKAYGALSVGVQVAATVEKLFVVRAGAFQPPPDVHSMAVRLTPRATPLVSADAHGAFRAFVAAIFSQRRKQMGRVLRSVADLPRPEAEHRLERLGIAPSARPETLHPAEFVHLFEAVARSA